MIDKITANLYACCKCEYQWTSWDGKNKKESPIPNSCPSCKNVRWNQEYVGEELELAEKIMKMHLIKKAAYQKDVVAYSNGRTSKYNIDYFDFIAYDFLHKTLPHPDLFELRPIVAQRNLEKRHEMMLVVIKDRHDNAEKYKSERYSKLGKWAYDNGFNNSVGNWFFVEQCTERKVMDGCKHRML